LTISALQTRSGEAETIRPRLRAVDRHSIIQRASVHRPQTPALRIFDGANEMSFWHGTAGDLPFARCARSGTALDVTVSRWAEGEVGSNRVNGR
jgi:hypothetical protein